VGTCKDCEKPAPRRCPLCTGRLEEVGYNIDNQQFLDPRDQCTPFMGDPPCGSCGSCLLQQAIYAGVPFWPEPVGEVFWQCRDCHAPMTIDEAAARFAAWWHYGQKYGERPYMYHVRMVVSMLRFHYPSAREHVVAAAWLHDTVEDTPLTLTHVHNSFGPSVAQMVELVSNGAKGTRREKHDGLLARLADPRHPWRKAATSVKLADRLANMTACKAGRKTKLFQMYADEWPSLREVAIANGAYAQSSLGRTLDELVADA
jgi:hypothetical protein